MRFSGSFYFTAACPLLTPTTVISSGPSLCLKRHTLQGSWIAEVVSPASRDRCPFDATWRHYPACIDIGTIVYVHQIFLVDCTKRKSTTHIYAHIKRCTRKSCKAIINSKFVIEVFFMCILFELEQVFKVIELL